MGNPLRSPIPHYPQSTAYLIPIWSDVWNETGLLGTFQINRGRLVVEWYGQPIRWVETKTWDHFFHSIWLGYLLASCSYLQSFVGLDHYSYLVQKWPSQYRPHHPHPRLHRHHPPPLPLRELSVPGDHKRKRCQIDSHLIVWAGLVQVEAMELDSWSLKKMEILFDGNKRPGDNMK